jgi:hypothetical protein
MKKKRHANKTKKPAKLQQVRPKVVKKPRRKVVRKTVTKTKVKKTKPVVTPKSKGIFSTSKFGGKRNKGTKTPVRKVAKKQPLQIKRKHGENLVGFKFRSKSLEKNIDLLDTSKDVKKQLDYFQSKNRPKKGAGYKPPKGVLVILKGKNGGEWTFKSPYDFVVNQKNIKGYIKGIVNKAEEKITYSRKNQPRNVRVGKYKKISGTEYDDPIDPNDINEIIIRYIY